MTKIAYKRPVIHEVPTYLGKNFAKIAYKRPVIHEVPTYLGKNFVSHEFVDVLGGFTRYVFDCGVHVEIWHDGDQSWFDDCGEPHREDGPACIVYDDPDQDEYHLHGEYIKSRDEFIALYEITHLKIYQGA